MLPQFRDHPVINLNTILSTDVETLKQWYIKYPDVYSFLNQPYSLQLLSQQYKIFSPVSTFPEFYTQYHIKYFPGETNVPSFVIAGIDINNDDPIALSNLMKSVNYKNKFNRPTEDHIVRIFKSNKIKLLDSLNVYGTKHMIDGCRGIIHDKSDIMFHTQSVCCAVACGHLDQVLKTDAEIYDIPRGLIIGGFGYPEMKKIIDIGLIPRDTIDLIVSDASHYDRLDILQGLQLGGYIDIGNILEWLQDLSSINIIKYYSTTDTQDDDENKVNILELLDNLFNKHESFYLNSAILTVQWLVEIDVITQTIIDESELLENICMNEDVESLVFLMDRFNLNSKLDQILTIYSDYPNIIARVYEKHKLMLGRK